MPALDAILSLTRVLTRAKDEDDLLAELAAELQRGSEADTVDILLTDSTDSLVLRASTVSPEFVYRLKLGKGIGLSGLSLTLRKPVFVLDKAVHHAKYAKYPGFEGRESEGFACFPIQDAFGRYVGVIAFGKGAAWPLNAKAKRDLGERVEIVAELLQAYRSAYDSGTQVNRLGALSEVTRIITTSPYVEEILQLLVNL